jgi:hypothetical protein
LIVAAAVWALLGPGGARAAHAGDAPPGFWYGTDSHFMHVTGPGPYREPVIGGNYGGYMGMAGNWARWGGCKTGNFLAWAPANANQANSNYVKSKIGVGVGVYWYMGGPGVDPHWNGTAAEAYKWGAQQAARALIDIANGGGIDYPVVWMDIEIPGIGPATDNGWNTVYTTPCSGKVKQQHILASIDRADFNGFYDYVTAHSKYRPGVYSAVVVWNSVFGGNSASPGSPGYIPNTNEWTYEPETTNYKGNFPTGFCLKSGGCAQFFGGVTRSSSHALMWQWSGGGGQTNGIGGFNGDLDQIDGARHP